VWFVETGALFRLSARVSAAEAALEPAERERYHGYRHDADRLMFLAGRVMARALVARALGIAPGGWKWREGQRGRPEIDAPDTALRFNLAHSAGLVACALANGRDVGVDVEYLRRRPVDPQVIPRYCAPDEVRDIHAHGPHGWHDRFLLYWTLKEAYLKARGLGISVPLSDISFAVDGPSPRVNFLRSLAGTDNRWTFHVARPTTEHVLAVAAPSDQAPPVIAVAPFPLELA
jgi:4'-phosphopantetheinyl transferase